MDGRRLILLLCVLAPNLAGTVLADDISDREQLRRALERENVRLRETVRDYQRKVEEADKIVEEDRERYTAFNKTANETSTALGAAKAAWNEVKTSETITLGALRRKAEAEPRNFELQEALREAQAALSTATERAMEPVKQTGPYREAIAAVEQAKAEMETLKQASAAPPDIAAAAQRIIDKDAAVAKIQEDATAADPACVSARADLAEATRAMTEYNRAADEKLRNDPLRLEAFQRVVDKTKKLDDAKAVNDKAQRQLGLAKNKYAASTSDSQKAKTRLKQAQEQLDFNEQRLRRF